MQNDRIATRLTCFAILSAAEQDIRNALEQVSMRAGRMDILPKEVRERAAKRWSESVDGASDGTVCNDFDLLPFTDFGDLAQILNLAANEFWTVDKTQVKGIASQLEKLTAARNRVCHSRPLEPDDFATFMDFAQHIIKINIAIAWPTLGLTLKQLADNPSFVLKLKIPKYWLVDIACVPHSLPAAEFDDTGFLGRATDRSELSRLLMSSHPVITVVGEGGIGKTALVLRCLYDLLEQGAALPYDAVVWVTLKARVLTPSGAREIENAITNTLNVVREIGKQLGVPEQPAANLVNVFREIGDYLREFRILLAIDNLETVAASTIRPLLTTIGPKSKVLITSRVGLGELELRYPLERLDPTTAQTLARRFAKVCRVNSVASAPSATITKYCELLYQNPLLIKWFVSSVAAGADPGKLLSRQGQPFVSVLKFCFENLFERLSPVEKKILHVLASTRRPVTQAELYYLMGNEDRDAVDWALNTLHRSSMLKITHDAASTAEIPTTVYALTEIAAEYVAACAPPPKDLFTSVQKTWKELRAIVDADAARTGTYKYDSQAIRARTPDQRICAAILRRALDARSRDLAEARRLVDEARGLAAGYAEVYRISGMIEAPYDAFRSASEFETAIDLDPQSLIAKYTYAYVLIRNIEDYEGALGQLEQVLAADPKDPAVLGLKGIALTRIGRLAEAAQVYEELLPGLDIRARKWRISTSHQAAECFRRYAEQDIHMQDYVAAGKHLEKSLSILGLAISKGDADDRICSLYLEVLDAAMRSCIDSRNTEAIKSVVHRLTNLHPTFANGRCDFANLAEFEQVCITDPDDLAAIRELPYGRALAQRKTWFTRSTEQPARATSFTHRPQPEGLRETTRVFGRVDKRPHEVPFGFIKASDGSSWFFHRDELDPGTRWVDCVVGAEVEFGIGENAKGPCAVAVRLVGSSKS